VEHHRCRVDGSRQSRKALKWAFAEAQYRKSNMLVVACSTSATESETPRNTVASSGDHGQLASTRRMLAAMVDNLAAAFPDVVQRQRVVSGDPAEQLVKLTEHAAMCVVGARGHGGFVGMLVGSVSENVLTHSLCCCTGAHSGPLVTRRRTRDVRLYRRLLSRLQSKGRAETDSVLASLYSCRPRRAPVPSA
jgi:nucleotide-binding universal stress UspA family protein